MNIDELIASSVGKHNVREYLEHPDFSSLYVRVTSRYINNKYVKSSNIRIDSRVMISQELADILIGIAKKDKCTDCTQTKDELYTYQGDC